MLSGAPLPWQGLKIARHLPPVCPQKLPDVSSQSSANISRARYRHLLRLLPYLKSESEDCLYLNLYVPHAGESIAGLIFINVSIPKLTIVVYDADSMNAVKSYAVLVYLHGESFEWNSGNAYDGSVLASYGEVIVVTVNYRLGVLGKCWVSGVFNCISLIATASPSGFMRPSIDAHNIANYALLDQIAALHWIKENIGSFGGDNKRVTLMGHSTGAACVNYLMVSPVSSGTYRLPVRLWLHLIARQQ